MTKCNEQMPTKKRSLTSQEQSAITRLKQRTGAPARKIFRTSKKGEDDPVAIDLAIDTSLDPQDATDLLDATIFATTGSSNRVVGAQLLTTLCKALVPAKPSKEVIANQIDMTTQQMQALAPQDEYEGQLIAQLVILHEHSLEWLGKAIRTERVDFANIYLNGASKLLTRHHETLESLLKYRRQGEQRVVVEHVHVHSGGQAIVGAITSGGGMKDKSEEGPHAKV